MKIMREEERKMLIKEIKESLLNPIMILSNILSVDLPVNAMPYLSIMYKTISELFQSMYIYEIFEKEITSVLDSNGITDDDILKIATSKNKLGMFIQLLDVVDTDMDKIQIRIAKSVTSGSNADEIKINLRRLLLNMSISESMVYGELKECTLITSETAIKRITTHLCKKINRIVDALMRPEKYNKKEEETDMKKERRHSKKVVTEFKKDNNGRTSFDVNKKESIKFNNTKKKRTKEELCNNINKLDKKYGCKLKHPKDTVDDEYEFNEMVNRYKEILARLLFALNGVNSSNNIVSNPIFGTQLKKIKINDFFKDSSEWFNNIDYFTNNSIYKVRFLSYLLTWAIKNLKKISEVMYYINHDGEFIEYEAKLSYVEKATRKICYMINKVLSGESYSEELLFFIKVEEYLSSPVKNINKARKKGDKIEFGLDQITDEIRGYVDAEQDETMDSILELAYLVSTGDMKCKGKIKFNPGYKFKNKSETKAMIEELGSAIIKNRKHDKIPKMFKFFIKSEPKIFSKWKDVNDNKPLLTGIVALEYLAFISDDKAVRKRISKLLSR